MAILTGTEIIKEIEKGNIVISEFDRKRLGPNGYNLRLANKLLVYTEVEHSNFIDERNSTGFLDMKKPNPTREIIIPEEGLILEPGVLYLGMKEEYTETHNHVPFLEGRSSTGRLGLDIHICAGAGEVSFQGNWTLEIRCIHPIKIYPGVEVCQIMYHTVEGDTEIKYTGKYQGSKEIRASRIYKDFEKGEN